MSSLFDPQQFLDGAEITGEMSTKVPVVPAGRYTMQIRNFTSKRIIPDDSSKKPFTTLEVECAISGTQITPTGEPLSAHMGGREESIVRYKCFLDFTEGGSLALGEGQNVGLGRLRAAVGQNLSGQPWRFGMLKGAVFSGEVFHRPDPKDSEIKYAEVKNPLPVQ